MLQDWMNVILICPKGCGVDKGYLAPEFPLQGRCFTCEAEMEGVRILKGEANV